MERFQLANIILEWDGGGFSLLPGRYMERFRWDGAPQGDVIRFQGRFVPLEEYIKRFPLLKENAAYATLDADGERMLVYHWGNRRFAFAIWPERISAERTNVCWFDPDMKNQPPLHADWFFGVSGLHKALMLREAVILHASCIERDGKAVLFAAPSGTGKSTQAQLWADTGRAEILNGDRVLLRRYQGVWHAYGYPCCGSSKICKNRTLPLQAVVVLEQGAENRVCALSAAQKIRALVSGIEVYLWDREEIDRSFCLAGQIAGEVPVIKLVCRPDAGAVAALDRYLEEEWYATGI